MGAVPAASAVSYQGAYAMSPWLYSPLGYARAVSMPMARQDEEESQKYPKRQHRMRVSKIEKSRENRKRVR